MVNKLTISDLIDRVESFTKLPQVEQVKLIGYFYCLTSGSSSFTTSTVKECFISCDLQHPKNVSDCISKLATGKNAVILKKDNAYSFQRDAKKQLDEIFKDSKHKQELSTTLRNILPKVKSDIQRFFLEEAITCFEVKCFRASIVMTWLLTIDILQDHVIISDIAAFNSAIQSHGKYKKITVSKKADLSDIKESDFIEILRVARLISGDIRKILDEKLNFRNTAAHPNNISVKETKAISFIEDLVDNIIVQYQ